MSLTTAVPAPAPQPASPSAHAARARELAALAYALSHALTTDRERPARWLSTPFIVSVEQARQRLARIYDVDALACAIDDLAAADARGLTSFATAVALLARDPRHIALAIRWHEITESTSLAGWPELVRSGIRRSDAPRGVHDAALWFG